MNVKSSHSMLLPSSDHHLLPMPVNPAVYPIARVSCGGYDGMRYLCVGGSGAAPVLRRLLRRELKDAHAVPVAGDVMRDVITLDDLGVFKPGAGKETG
jgi:hypothetical protein